MEHQAKGQLSGIVQLTSTCTKLASLHIALTVARTQENILPSAAIDHALDNRVMLGLDAIVTQFGAMLVPLKVRTHLVLHVSQEGIDGQAIAAAQIQRFDALGLRTDALHHPHFVDHPDQGRLPVNRLGNTL